jgi:5-methyltetrahydrofolate--homocysteine methyltransferase
MDSNDLVNRFGKEILILDGSTGVLIRKMGLQPGEPPENLILRKPEAVTEVHRQYLDSGADIILTNTFGATRLRLQDNQLEENIGVINREAVKLARSVADGRAYIGLSIGPLGKFLKPIGELEFLDALDLYREQVRAAMEERPDLAVIETISDIREFKAAIIAVKSESDLPIIAHMTFTEDGRTVTGTDPLTCVSVATALGVEVVGANCSVGPKELYPVMIEMSESSTIPLSVEPNAGLPKLKNGIEIYPSSPDEMARFSSEFVEIGVSVVGACCGSTPEHIAAIRETLVGRNVTIREKVPTTRLSGRSLTVEVADHMPIVIIGERINPSGRKDLTRAIESRDTAFLRREATEQVSFGANLLDVNMGINDKDPVGTMVWALQTIQQAIRVPVIVDSSDPEVVESALREIEGKTMLNSVSGERDSLESLVPLAKQYGAAILGITLDEDGIPDNVLKRLQIAERIIEFALSRGISLEDIVIDPLALPVSAEQQKVLDSLEAIRLIKEELGVKTVMGVSNVSFGLPERKIINTTFLSMALSRGLDLPIINPLDDSIKGVIHAANLLLGKDLSGTRYIQSYGTQVEGVEKKTVPLDGMPVEEAIFHAILEGSREEIDGLIVKALEKGMGAQEITDQCLVTAMEKVGDLFETKVYFLPQVILSAETMQRGFSIVKPHLESREGEKQAGKILFATVKGDIHDIGKNICITLLENHGFEVVDLGKNVETHVIVERARQEEVDIVAMSALMTTTMVRMKDVIETLKKNDVDARTMIGGAVVTQEYADEIGADGYGANAVKAVKVAKKLSPKKASL